MSGRTLLPALLVVAVTLCPAWSSPASAQEQVYTERPGWFELTVPADWKEAEHAPLPRFNPGGWNPETPDTTHSFRGSMPEFFTPIRVAHHLLEPMGDTPRIRADCYATVNEDLARAANKQIRPLNLVRREIHTLASTDDVTRMWQIVRISEDDMWPEYQVFMGVATRGPRWVSVATIVAASDEASLAAAHEALTTVLATVKLPPVRPYDGVAPLLNGSTFRPPASHPEAATMAGYRLDAPDKLVRIAPDGTETAVACLVAGRTVCATFPDTGTFRATIDDFAAWPTLKVEGSPVELEIDTFRYTSAIILGVGALVLLLLPSLLRRRRPLPDDVRFNLPAVGLANRAPAALALLGMIALVVSMPILEATQPGMMRTMPWLPPVFMIFGFLGYWAVRMANNKRVLICESGVWVWNSPVTIRHREFRQLKWSEIAEVVVRTFNSGLPGSRTRYAAIIVEFATREGMPAVDAGGLRPEISPGAVTCERDAFSASAWDGVTDLLQKHGIQLRDETTRDDALTTPASS